MRQMLGIFAFLLSMTHAADCNISEPVAMLQHLGGRPPLDVATLLERASEQQEEMKQLLQEQRKEMTELVAQRDEMKRFLQARGEPQPPPGASSHGGRPPQRQQELFENCASRPHGESLAQSGKENASSGDASSSSLSCPSSTSNPTFPIFELSSGQYGCCPETALYCGGCADIGADECNQCAGSHTDTSGSCEACVDTPGWATTDGHNCASSETDGCSDALYDGLSSSQACCKCGGGHRAATPFTYYVAPVALHSFEVDGFPVPRTAEKYSVDKDCQLLEHGMTINGETGGLQVSEGSRVGGTKQEAFTISCTVTAHQSGGLTASTTLTVQVDKGVSYGLYPFFFFDGGLTEFTPSVELGLVAGSTLNWSFDQLTCSPSDAEHALNLNSTTGAISLSESVANGGVTDLGEGGICSVRATPSASPYGPALLSLQPLEPVISRFVAVKPKLWESLAYAGSFQAAIGEQAPTAKPMLPKDSPRLLRPSAFAAKCDSNVSVDAVTGQASYQGFHVFDFDLATGFLRLKPEDALSGTFPAQESGRASLSFKCDLFGLYRFPPFGTGPVLKTTETELKFKTAV